MFIPQTPPAAATGRRPTSPTLPGSLSYLRTEGPAAILVAATSLIRHIFFPPQTDPPLPRQHPSPPRTTRHASSPVSLQPHTPILRRQLSDHELRVIIGVTVSILLTVFIAGSCVFMYMYRPTLRFRRRRHRHHHSHKSAGSRSSHASMEPAPPPPPPPPPPHDGDGDDAPED